MVQSCFNLAIEILLFSTFSFLMTLYLHYCGFNLAIEILLFSTLSARPIEEVWGILSFNLAIEILLFSTVVEVGSDSERPHIVSISRSRYFYFQLTSLSTSASTGIVSISRSRYFYFQLRELKRNGVTSYIVSISRSRYFYFQ